MSPPFVVLRCLIILFDNLVINLDNADYFDVQDDLSQRSLPNDGTLYPYLTIGDFLEDTIIQVPHTLNKSSFFNGNYDGPSMHKSALFPHTNSITK